MGIARRKAGTVVRCPTCAGQVIVPNPPEEERPEEPLFERSDFAEVLSPAALEKGASVSQSSGASSPPGSWKKRGDPAYNVDQLEPAPGPSAGPGAALPGFFLSHTRATVLAVVIIVLLALAFVAGLLVGRSLHNGAPGQAASVCLPEEGATAARV